MTALDTMVTGIHAAQDRITLKQRGQARWYECLAPGSDTWERYPGVTSILKVVAKPFLVPWAAKLQYEADVQTAWGMLGAYLSPGLSLSEYAQRFKAAAPKKKAHATVLEEASTLGKEVHALIENNLRERMGAAPIAGEPSDRAQYVYAGFEAWADSVHLKPLLIEAKVASFTHRYCGTLDNLAIVEIDGGIDILDWKTSKGIYPEMRLQNVAYRKAVEEMTGVLPGGRLVRLPKDGDMTIEQVRVDDDVDELFAVFLALRSCYDWARANEVV